MTPADDRTTHTSTFRPHWYILVGACGMATSTTQVRGAATDKHSPQFAGCTTKGRGLAHRTLLELLMNKRTGKTIVCNRMRKQRVSGGKSSTQGGLALAGEEGRERSTTPIEDLYSEYTVYDMHYEKVGKIDDLFVDENDNPEYVGVKMGFLGTRSTLIPVDIVQIGR